MAAIAACPELDYAAALLVQFDGLEQRLKIPFAKAVIALALDDFEEYRADRVLREDLEKNSAGGIAVDQDAAPLEFAQVLLMAGDARVDTFIVGGGRVLEFDAQRAQGVDRAVDVQGAQGDVLNAFALVFVEVFLYLALVVLALVDGNADLPQGEVSARENRPVSLPSILK